MALTSTIYNFDIDLADIDRGVYETLALRVAQHPSESEDYLLTRVLAYLLEYADGIQFSSGGLSNPDAPAITVTDLTGVVQSWIEVGTPDSERLHRASKASPRVAVYVHKDPTQFLNRLSGERIHRAESVEIYAVDRQLLADLVNRLERRMNFSVSVTDRELCVSVGSQTFSGDVTRHPL